VGLIAASAVAVDEGLVDKGALSLAAEEEVSSSFLVVDAISLVVGGSVTHPVEASRARALSELCSGLKLALHRDLGKHSSHIVGTIAQAAQSCPHRRI
jgi:hypothetical protein